MEEHIQRLIMAAAEWENARTPVALFGSVSAEDNFLEKWIRLAAAEARLMDAISNVRINE